MKRALGAALALGLVACSAPAATPSARCEPYPMDRAAQIVKSSGMSAVKAGAVKSLEHSKAWYVAIRFRGPGVENEIGVWATNDLDTGSVLAVDGMAQEFSSFPTNDGFSTTDKGAAEVRTCV